MHDRGPFCLCTTQATIHPARSNLQLSFGVLLDSSKSFTALHRRQDARATFSLEDQTEFYSQLVSDDGSNRTVSVMNRSGRHSPSPIACSTRTRPRAIISTKPDNIDPFSVARPGAGSRTGICTRLIDRRGLRDCVKGFLGLSKAFVAGHTRQQTGSVARRRKYCFVETTYPPIGTP